MNNSISSEVQPDSAMLKRNRTSIFEDRLNRDRKNRDSKINLYSRPNYQNIYKHKSDAVFFQDFGKYVTDMP